MKKIISKKSLLVSMLSLAVLCLSQAADAAWINPTAGPATFNVAAPINAGGALQNKVGSFGSSGSISAAGALSAGTLITTPSLKVTSGAVAGRVLTSDVDGNATWVAPGAGADNLGNHLATQILNLNSNDIINVNSIGTRFLNLSDYLNVNTADAIILHRQAGYGTMERDINNLSLYVDPSDTSKFNIGSFNSLSVGGSAVCQANGVNCQAAVGDNLGNHSATQLLTMNGNNIIGVGSMIANSSISASVLVTAPSFCIGGDCRSSWGSVANVGGALGGCTDATTSKIYWNGSQLVCGADQAGSGADNLGNHSATAGLTMNWNNITSVNSLTATGASITNTITGTLRVTGGAVAGRVLTSDDSGNATWQAPGAGADGLGAGNTGTAGYVVKWMSGSSIGPSLIREDAGNVGIGTAPISQIRLDLASGLNYGIRTNGALYGTYSTSGGTGVYAAGVLGVYGSGTNTGVMGESNNVGVYGTSIDGRGVDGASFNNMGVYGHSTNGTGVFGQSVNSTGGYFASGTGYALITGTGNVGIGTANPRAKLSVGGAGEATAQISALASDINQGKAIYADGGNTRTGLYATSWSGNAVFGANNSGYSVVGYSNNGTGIWGRSVSGVGGWFSNDSGGTALKVDGISTFNGNTTVNGNLTVDGTFAVKVDGATLVLQYDNVLEDVYSAPISSGSNNAGETCNADNTNVYGCLKNERKTCVDVWRNTNIYYKRTVTCKLAAVLSE